MAKLSRPRSGSLQYWPRKRASKIIPSVNWSAIFSQEPLLGFIGYKAGMKSAYVKDNTQFSMTKGKRIAIPVTILECPPLKIFSIRFYKNGKVMKEVLGDNLEKELQRKVKLPKNKETKLPVVEGYDDIRIIAYAQAKKTGIKKVPDMIELALGGSLEDKMKFVQEHRGKEISIHNIIKKNMLIDIRGTTKGKGLVGPVKRFGISFKSHKSEKGQRRPGSLGPWHPARVTFKAPQAGQLGMFSRIVYNLKVLDVQKPESMTEKIQHYGDIRADYLVITGSIPGPAKRPLLITMPLRVTKKQDRKNYELMELR